MRIVRSQTTIAGAAVAIAVFFALAHLSARPAPAKETAAKQSKNVIEANADADGEAEGAEGYGEGKTAPDPLPDPLEGESAEVPEPFIWTIEPPFLPGTEGADWFMALPKSESFREFELDSAGAGSELSLTWQVTDNGPAVVDDAGTIDSEGNHDRSPALVIGWRGKTLVVPLDDTWMYVESSSYFDRKKDARASERKENMPLSSFVLANIRGEVTYEVRRAPHSLVVIQEDTTPYDGWIPMLHEIKEGPYTTSLETQWFRYAEIAIDVPADVPLRERVQEREKNRPW